MNTATTISNRHANWAAIVDARAARLDALNAHLTQFADQADAVDDRLTGAELKALIARARWTTYCDQQALGPAPDPLPLPRLHQVFRDEEHCEMCGKLVGVPRGEHWRECLTPF
jgi:hypothetical protein